MKDGGRPEQHALQAKSEGGIGEPGDMLPVNAEVSARCNVMKRNFDAGWQLRFQRQFGFPR